MKLFGLKNKKSQEKPVCCCKNEVKASVEVETSEKANANIKVLGSGCKKCNDLEKATIEALVELNMDTNIEHVTDFVKIAEYSVMMTPALVVGNKVVSYGKVLSKDQVVELLKKVL